ncbi:MAG: hypothetical protein QGG80_05760 [Candidatus Krumholzibacteria bacterium]|nr:hypothetical protein [Candidatus Krumholzibacteria bacterium]MDP6796652.1 hypothetical protein [Candidatus Krumholzibacteria bacterium]
MSDRIRETALAFEGQGNPRLLLSLAPPASSLKLPGREGSRLPLSQVPHCPSRGDLEFREDGSWAVIHDAPSYYEGESMASLVQVLRAMKAGGLEALILCAPASPLGGEGSGLLLFSDHLNLAGDNPLIGENDESLGPRFPDVRNTWTPHLRDRAAELLAEAGHSKSEGIFAYLSGPNLNTPAEREFMKRLGADFCGIYHLPEALAASHAGIPVLGLAWPGEASDPPGEHTETLQFLLEALIEDQLE